MISIEYSFGKREYSLLKEMIGKNFTEYKCDPFIYSASVYGLVGLFIGEKSYSCTNFIQAVDHFGSTDDVARFLIDETEEANIHSLIQGQSMISHAINSTIQDIIVVEEKQALYRGEEHLYDFSVTRGIIFKLEDGLEFSLEKDVWFSETITVSKGYNRILSFVSPDQFSEGWDEGYRGECTRLLVSVSELISEQ